MIGMDAKAEVTVVEEGREVGTEERGGGRRGVEDVVVEVIVVVVRNAVMGI